MLRQAAEGVLIHQSEFCQSNAVVVQGQAGALLIDAGIYGYEMDCLANDLSESGQTVAAGFSTHFHWDHVLWHARFGAAVTRGSAHQPHSIGCPACTNGNYSSSPYEESATGRPHRDPLAARDDFAKF